MDRESIKLPSVTIERKSLIDAYTTKKERCEVQKTNKKMRNKSLSPVKFSHNLPQTPGFKYLQTLHSSTNDQNQPHHPQYHCNETQKKLAEINSYTGMYKKRFDPNEKVHSSGEICESPMRAIRMLNSTSVGQLNIPARSGDFRNEVEWRLQLRPQFN